MPAYGSQTTTNSPLYSLSHGIPGGVTLWNADTQAAVTASPFSLAVAVPTQPYTNGQKKVSIEIHFSGAPGTFSIQVQDADTDITGAYASIPFGGATPGVVSTVNSSNYARVELNIDGSFLRLNMATPPSNNVAVTAQVFLQ